ncbi:DUF190 domain-containing protein [Candidatus Micrarchaeota archaeon]|nr:DUF190 domain-containing protein [Candidatus Micrarchaeota archaeon]
MKRESEAVLLRIFIGESDRFEGKPLDTYIIEMCKKDGLAGATAIRGVGGFGKSSHMHTTSILRLSTDLPVLIEVVDNAEKIEGLKKKLDSIIKEGLITEEKVKVIIYEGNKKEE